MPLQTHQLTAATAGVDQDVAHGLPLDGHILRSPNNFCNIFGLEVVSFFLGYLGRRCLGSGVIRDQQFLLRHRHNHGNQTVVLQNRFIRQGLELVLHHKQFGNRIAQKICKLFCIRVDDGIAPEDCIQGGMGEACLLDNGSFGPFQCGDFLFHNLLGSGDCSLIPNSVFGEMLVKIVQVVGADVRQLHVTNPIVDPGQHGAVSLDGGGRESGSGFQIDHVFCVLVKLLSLVDLVTGADFFFKFDGG